MCPYKAVDDAIWFYALRDSARSYREVDAKFRESARKLKKALAVSTKALSSAFDEANEILSLRPDDDLLGLDIRDVKYEPWASAVKIYAELQRLALITAEETKGAGRKGETKYQSIVDGFLIGLGTRKRQNAGCWKHFISRTPSCCVRSSLP